MRKHALLVGLIGLLVLGQTSVTFGQGGCGPLGTDVVRRMLTSADTKAIFTGKVIESEAMTDGFLVTFLVDRVWKGDVHRNTFIYQLTAWVMYSPAAIRANPGNPDPGSLAVRPVSELTPDAPLLPFQVGVEYFVSATNLQPRDPRDFKRFNVEGFVRGSAQQCVTMPLSPTIEKMLSELQSRPPL
jgi:hypothetical protein